MGEKKKVVMITKNFILNGISTVVSNYCDNLPDDKYDVTILAGSKIDPKYKDKYNKNSCIKLIECPSKTENPRGYWKVISKYLKDNPVDIVHIHGNSATCTVELIMAWFRGVKKRVMHCHSTSCDHVKIHKLFRPLLNALCTDRCACSEVAGKWLYGNKPFTVIPNAFETERFRYNPEARKKIRNNLGIHEEMVLGHVGSFKVGKNHDYLLKVFEEYCNRDQNAYLLLVGGGPNPEFIQTVKEMVKESKHGSHVIFYGKAENVSDLYSAMDLFVFPSKFEGLGNVTIEAQISGLPCILSDVVPKEVDLGGDVKWISINVVPTVWANQIHALSEDERINFIAEHEESITRYQIKNTIKILEDVYV